MKSIRIKRDAFACPKFARRDLRGGSTYSGIYWVILLRIMHNYVIV